MEVPRFILFMGFILICGAIFAEATNYVIITNNLGNDTLSNESTSNNNTLANLIAANNITQLNLANTKMNYTQWLSENTTIQNTYKTISSANSDNTTQNNRQLSDNTTLKNTAAFLAQTNNFTTTNYFTGDVRSSDPWASGGWLINSGNIYGQTLFLLGGINTTTIQQQTINGSQIPSVTNQFTLGNSTHQYSGLYGVTIFENGIDLLTRINSNNNTAQADLGKKLNLTGGNISGAINLATSSGNVGIGTTGPTELLTINSAAATSANIKWSVNAATYGYVGIAGSANALITGSVLGDLGIRSEAKNILFSTDSGTTAHMYIKNGGNVGIGTTSPNYKFVVSNAGAEGIEMGLQTGYGEIYTYNRVTSAYIPLVLQGGGGNVGIGTTNPVEKLRIKGSGTTSATYSLAILNSAESTAMFIRDDLFTYFGGDVQINALTGSGNDYACLDANGKLFRSDSAC